jgi:hypothetical protein
VLADYRFKPGLKIKDCMQLVTAIHLINPFQQMAIMTADPKEARVKMPQALRHTGAAEAVQDRASASIAAAARTATVIRMVRSLIGGRLI